VRVVVPVDQQRLTVPRPRDGIDVARHAQPRFGHHAAGNIHDDYPKEWQARPIAEALKRYGMILVDNGSDWYVSGASDPRFDDDVLHELDVIHGSDLGVVDTSSLINGP
jgi:hypothetical protein